MMFGGVGMAQKRVCDGTVEQFVRKEKGAGSIGAPEHKSSVHNKYEM